MKNYIFAGLFSSVLLLSPFGNKGAFAAAVAGKDVDFGKGKLGVVDMQAIEGKADVVRDLMDKLQNEQSKLREMINNKSKDLQKRARELETKRGVLSATAIEEKRKSLENELLVLQSDAQVKSDNLQNAKNEALLEIDLKVRNVVQKVAKNSGLQLVVPKQVALFVGDEIAQDVTDAVLKDLNSSFKTIDLGKHLSGKGSSLFGGGKK